MRSKGMGTLCGLFALSLVLGDAEAQDPSLAARARRATEPAPAPPSGGLQVGPATVAAHWSKYDYPRSIPDGASYYIIEKGDTLWDLARRFLGNPYLWPQIWDQNRYITDAHWIYPGDPLIIPKVEVITERAGEEAMTEEEAARREVRAAGAEDVLYPVIAETALQCAPYVLPGREDESLYIIGSEQGASKVAFADRDVVYLNRGSNAGVRAGDVYTIHHATYEVKHPDTNRGIGTKIETSGWLRVLLVQENSATATVEQACQDIHMGDYLKPFEKVSVPLVLRRPPADRQTPPSGKTTGAVVDIDHDSMIAGAEQLVIVNLGSANGIAPGNMFVIYRIMYPSVPTSRVIIGELAVVATRERTATAKVTYSNDAILNGDRIELK